MNSHETPPLSHATLFSIALKNLARHRRRTGINAVSVAVSVGIAAFFAGYYRGSYEELLYSTVIDYQTGHAQIQTAAFVDDDPDAFVKANSLMTDWHRTVTAVRAADGVVGAAPRLMVAGFGGDGRDRFPLMITGVEPEAERAVGVVERSIVRGADLERPGTILVGEAFARLFSLEPGSRCLIQTWTSYGSPNVQAFTVSGVFRTGFAPLDRNSVFIRLADAQALADSGDTVNKIVVKSESVEAAERALPDILASARESGYDAKPWTHYAASLIEHARTEQSFYYIFLVVLFALSVSTIASTMYVTVFERTREIGMLRAVGWRQDEVFRLFAFEAMAVGLVGAAIGVVLGGAGSFLLAAFPVDVRSMSSAVDIPFFEIKSAPRAEDFIVAGVLGALVAFVAGIAPAGKAARTDIIRALSTR